MSYLYKIRSVYLSISFVCSKRDAADTCLSSCTWKCILSSNSGPLWGTPGDKMTIAISAASSSCWRQIVYHRLSSGDKPERAKNNRGHQQFSSHHLCPSGKVLQVHHHNWMVTCTQPTRTKKVYVWLTRIAIAAFLRTLHWLPCVSHSLLQSKAKPWPQLKPRFKQTSSLCWLKTYSGPHNAVFTTHTHTHTSTCTCHLELSVWVRWQSQSSGRNRREAVNDSSVSLTDPHSKIISRTPRCRAPQGPLSKSHLPDRTHIMNTSALDLSGGEHLPEQ